MAVRCKTNGNAKAEPTESGACPECLTPDVPTTGKGFVAAHDVKVSLGEGPQVPVTDEGTRVGDPRDAAVRREIEGRKVSEPVTVRYDAESRTYVHGNAAPRRDASASDPVETTGHGRGPVLVRGRAMEPFAGEVVVFPAGTPEAERVTVLPEDTRKGWSGQTMNGPTGRERSEREAMVGGRYGYLARPQYDRLSRTQQRKYWAKVDKQKKYAQAQRQAAQARTRVPVRYGTGGVGSTGFAEGASRVTEHLMKRAPEF